jgi:signal transduction histidine kinase
LLFGRAGRPQGECMEHETPQRGWLKGGGYFRKFVASFVGLVVLVLAVNASLETYFVYRNTTDLVVKSQTEKAEGTVRRIEQFLTEIERQISWATRASTTTVEQRRADYALLLQQAPSIERLIQLDSSGIEQLRATRQDIVVGSGLDYSGDPRFRDAKGQLAWWSPIYFNGRIPFIAIAVAHSGPNAGSTVAEISLKFLGDFIDRAQVGADTEAYIVDPSGRLLVDSNPDRSLGTSLAALPQVAALLGQSGERPMIGKDLEEQAVLVGTAVVPQRNWYIFFEQPLTRALEPVYILLYRTLWLIGLGIGLSVLAGMLLARRLVTPIRALQVGARQLEASNFGYRIDVQSRDEIGELANQFNRMADQLQGSYGRLEQKVAERTRDLAQSIGELQALEEIGRTLASSLDLKAVLATIVTRAVELSHADAGAIYAYEPARDMFELAESHGLDDAFKSAVRATHIAFDAGVMGRWATQQKPIVIPDLSTFTDFPLRELTVSAGFNSLLFVPLAMQDRIFGALVLHRRSKGEFPARTVELIQTFAHQSVLAMNNAGLFREVEQRGRELAIASAHKSQFFANMSHELRTPLNAVLGYSELLADGLYGPMPEKAAEVLERIQSNGKHLLGLINDVLDLSKIEAGQLTLALEDYSVETMVQSVVSAAGSLARNKGIEVTTAVAPNLPMGRGDERRLTQVLLNLVSNAIKFTDAGSVGIDVQAVDGQFRIAVSDTGPGIAPDDQQKIFEEFQQVDNSSTRAKGGTGLGLSISRRLVDMHGGRIDLVSTVGVGSTFSVIIPIRVDEQREQA